MYVCVCERESENKIVPFVTMSKKCFPKLYSYLLTTRLSKSYQDMKPLLKEPSGEGRPRRGWGKSQPCFMSNAYLKDSLQSDVAELGLRNYQLIRWQLK